MQKAEIVIDNKNNMNKINFNQGLTLPCYQKVKTLCIKH